MIRYGPERGQETSYVRVDQWLPKQRKVSEAEAQRTVPRSYLGAQAKRGSSAAGDRSICEIFQTDSGRDRSESKQPGKIPAGTNRSPNQKLNKCVRPVSLI
jgi:hypothetical protein